MVKGLWNSPQKALATFWRNSLTYKGLVVYFPTSGEKLFSVAGGAASITSYAGVHVVRGAFEYIHHSLFFRYPTQMEPRKVSPSYEPYLERKVPYLAPSLSICREIRDNL